MEFITKMISFYFFAMKNRATTRPGDRETGRKRSPQMASAPRAGRLPLTMIIAIGALLLSTAGCNPYNPRARAAADKAKAAGALSPEAADEAADFFASEFLPACETASACTDPAPHLSRMVRAERARTGDALNGVKFLCHSLAAGKRPDLERGAHQDQRCVGEMVVAADVKNNPTK